MKIAILLILIALFSAGCATYTMPQYVWGNYHQTLFNYKAHPTVENLQTHINTLNNIIKYSKQYDRKVPPGIYVELAFMTRCIDRKADVSQYLEQEKLLYPESTKYVDFADRKLFR
jgi:hypothetical protein